ncbi:MAG: carboxypeptidase-like regulatory domain-containing protein [Terracidiphilus sp.]
MAETGRMGPMLLAALMVCAGATAGAQTAGSGALTGKLTDLHSAPLEETTVVVRNESTGAQAQAKTQKNGSFRFTGLEPGAYTVEAESERLGRGRLEGVVVSAGHEAHVQAAMALEPVVARLTDEAVAATAPAVVVALRELALIERGTSELARERTGTETAVVTGALDAETLRRLTMSARALPDETRVMPATETLGLLGVVASEPLKTLNLSGHGESGIGSGDGASNGQITVLAAAGGSVVIDAAVFAAQAAIGAVQPGAGPAATATARVDPVAEAVATTVSAAELQGLPAAGRRWQDFVLDTPTAATAAGGTSPTLLRGAGPEPPETSMDGVSTRLAFGGQGSSGLESQGAGSNGRGGSDQNGMVPAWAGGRGSPVAEAAIREVETVAGNAEAEGARAAGGQLNVETMRGTNGLHGQGFLFDRQNTWGAQNPFTQWVKETAQGTPSSTPVFTAESYTPPDRETVWGVGVGSQIKREKLFLVWRARQLPARRSGTGYGEAP